MMIVPPLDQTNGLRKILRTLVQHNVDFVVCGGVACVLHGVARSTHDVDICVRLETDNLQKLIAAVGDLQMQPRAPEPIESLLDPAKRDEWITQKGALAFTLIFLDSPIQLDVFLTYPVDYANLRWDAVVLEFADCDLHVSSRQHLIDAKSAVIPPRKVDVRDIADLQELIDRDSA